jgi:putative heme-binding domain-containing protein
LIARLDALYPSSSPRINRELCPILAYLDSPSVIAKTLALMQHAQPSDALAFALALRTVKNVWTLQQRREYFRWLDDAASGKLTGGISLSLFLSEIRHDAVATLSPHEKSSLGSLIDEPGPRTAAPSTSPAPKFVRHWTASELVAHAGESLERRSFASGKAAFESASCLRCHRFGEQGESAAPNLTVVGNRFNAADLLESILSPSKMISDQYANTDLILGGELVVSGRIVREDATRVTVAESQFRPAASVTVAKRDIRERRLSAISPMPAGLLDGLTREQIMDLIAYLRSAGNPQDEAFSPANP